MEREEVREIILRELPDLVTRDVQIRAWVDALVHEHAPSRGETESRFDQVMAELRALREEGERRWEEQDRKWEENLAAERRRWEEHLAEDRRRWEEYLAEDRRRWEEQERKWEEQNRKWEESLAEDRRRWEEQERKWEENQRELRALREESERRWEEYLAEDRRRWEEQNRKWEESLAEDRRRWEEQNRKWEESTRQFNFLMDELRKSRERFDHTLGALGARWGLSSEEAFRNGLKAILEEVIGFSVDRVLIQDEEGEVFGHPAEVELDVVMRNGRLLICEIKSSASRGDVSVFERKVCLYEKRYRRHVDRKLLISPMVEERGKELAQEFGIEVYTSPRDVKVE